MEQNYQVISLQQITNTDLFVLKCFHMMESRYYKIKNKYTNLALAKLQDMHKVFWLLSKEYKHYFNCTSINSQRIEIKVSTENQEFAFHLFRSLTKKLKYFRMFKHRFNVFLALNNKTCVSCSKRKNTKLQCLTFLQNATMTNISYRPKAEMFINIVNNYFEDVYNGIHWFNQMHSEYDHEIVESDFTNLEFEFDKNL